ncbi:MAG: SRPBCC family protein [Actinomycetia bacterium]|nr:SRPBCC family protein [Actinomycetes bacterium]MCH9801010.1 SRPBCC family protein [Actinomycetes bacterium]
MNEMVVQQQVDAPAETVWRVVTDVEHAAEFISGITHIERVDTGSDFVAGFSWRETRRMFGKEVTELMTVVAVEEGHSYDVESISRGANYYSTVTVAASGSGSMLTMRFRGEAQGTVNKLLVNLVGRLFAGVNRKAMQQDLLDIAAVAEQNSRT